MFTKKIKTLSAVLAAVAVLFSACLKEETVELSPNPLEILNDKQLVFFKLDSVQFVPTFPGVRDVYIYYSNNYKTLPVETQKKMEGVALLDGRGEKITNTNQKVFFLPEQVIGTNLQISFAFTLNGAKERTRWTTFPITVR